jgi:hypothetical protein
MLHPNHPHLDLVSVGVVQHPDLVPGLLYRDHLALARKDSSPESAVAASASQKANIRPAVVFLICISLRQQGCFRHIWRQTENSTLGLHLPKGDHGYWSVMLMALAISRLTIKNQNDERYDVQKRDEHQQK